MFNNWLIYKKDIKSAQTKYSQIMPLQAFKMSIAESLMMKGKEITKKQEHPFSGSFVEIEFSKKKHSRQQK